MFLISCSISENFGISFATPSPPTPPPFEGWCSSAGNPGSAHTYHMRDVSVPVADMFGHSKNWGAGGKVLILSPFSLVHVVSAKTKIVLGAREETKKILSTDKMLCKIIHMTKIVSFISRQFIPENKPFHIIWPHRPLHHCVKFTIEKCQRFVTVQAHWLKSDKI